MIKSKKLSSGFTIIEIIVTITIIGILATIGVVGYGSWQSSITKTQIESDLKGAATAMENYRNFNNAYPLNVLSVFTPSSGITITGGSIDGKNYSLDGKKGSSSTYNITNTITTPREGSYTSILAGWWRLNGDTNDSSGNGRHAVPVPAGVTPTIGKDGTANGAYSFNGTATSYIDFNNISSSVFNFSNITMMSWVKRATTTGTQNIFGKQNQYKYRFSGANNHIDVLISSPNGNGAWDSPSTNKCNWNYPISFPAGFTVGTWYHIAVAIDSTTLKATAYVNGNSIGFCTFAASITGYSTSKFYAGVTSPNYEPFNGSLDDIRIYNRVLTQAEIQTVYNDINNVYL